MCALWLICTQYKKNFSYAILDIIFKGRSAIFMCSSKRKDAEHDSAHFQENKKC